MKLVLFGLIYIEVKWYRRRHRSLDPGQEPRVVKQIIIRAPKQLKPLEFKDKAALPKPRARAACCGECSSWEPVEDKRDSRNGYCSKFNAIKPRNNKECPADAPQMTAGTL